MTRYRFSATTLVALLSSVVVTSISFAAAIAPVAAARQL